MAAFWCNSGLTGQKHRNNFAKLDFLKQLFSKKTPFWAETKFLSQKMRKSFIWEGFDDAVVAVVVVVVVVVAVVAVNVVVAVVAVAVDFSIKAERWEVRSPL